MLGNEHDFQTVSKLSNPGTHAQIAYPLHSNLMLWKLYAHYLHTLCLPCNLPYSGFISLSPSFPKWSVLSFSRNFPDLGIHDPVNQKTHTSEISHKVYVCT